MLSDCHECTEAGKICRTDPEGAEALHGKCKIVKCPCRHIVPERA